MKRNGKLMGLLLALCLALTLLPTAAFAADDVATVQLGTEGVQAADQVYYGVCNINRGYKPVKNKPVLWYVIGSNGEVKEPLDKNAATLFFLSQNSINSLKFNETAIETYNNSKLQQTMGLYYTGTGTLVTLFTDLERSAIGKTILSEGEGTLTEFDAYLFPLSLAEVNSAISIVGENAIYESEEIGKSPARSHSWWLRSFSSTSKGKVLAVYPAKRILEQDFTSMGGIGVRPAFNLNLENILLISHAEGEEKTAAVGSFSAVSRASVDAWKLTLLDKGRTFTASLPESHYDAAGKTYRYEPGASVEVTYSGAKAGDSEYVSAILLDENGGVLYYGTVAQNSTGDAGSITLPESLTMGKTYELRVFSEQRNGKMRTDYASDFQTFSITITMADTTAPVLTAGAVSRTSDAAGTVKFTSDEAGTYYYVVVDSGTAMPTMGTTGTGTACVNGENTISFTDLTAGAKDVYIVASDAAGNVSEVLKITLPAYAAPSYYYAGTGDSTDKLVTSPKTGDAGNVGLWTVLAGVALLGTAVLYRSRKGRAAERGR